MKSMRLYKEKGFTLIELMIVVGIIGIIAAIAYPSYMQSVRKSNRAEAKVYLNDVAQRLQRCFTVYSAYDNASCTVSGKISGGNSLDTGNGYYSITGVLTTTTYTLTASPVSGSIQGGDSSCKTFTLNQTGVKNATGADASRCW